MFSVVTLPLFVIYLCIYSECSQSCTPVTTKTFHVENSLATLEENTSGVNVDIEYAMPDIQNKYIFL